MTPAAAAQQCLAYRRNVGAKLSEVHNAVRWETKKKVPKKETRALLEARVKRGELVQVGERWFFTPKAWREARGSALRATWQSEDAWILLAALMGSRPGTLRDLIGAADYLNHAIPTHEELHGAINRLLAGRLLRTARGKLGATERATELFEKAKSTGRKGWLDVLGRLRRLLDCPCCGVELKAVRWKYALDAEAYRVALATYRATF